MFDSPLHKSDDFLPYYIHLLNALQEKPQPCRLNEENAACFNWHEFYQFTFILQKYIKQKKKKNTTTKPIMTSIYYLF